MVNNDKNRIRRRKISSSSGNNNASSSKDNSTGRLDRTRIIHREDRNREERRPFFESWEEDTYKRNIDPSDRDRILGRVRRDNSDESFESRVKKNSHGRSMIDEDDIFFYSDEDDYMLSDKEKHGSGITSKEIEKNVRKRKEEKNRFIKSLVRKVISLVVTVSIVMGVLSFGYYKIVTRNMPAVTPELIEENYIAKQTVSKDDIPKDLKNAIVSIEDERFYTHKGVDLQAILRSALNNLVTDSRQGGSTIEMQLSKNLLTSSEVSIKRKLMDVHNALEMDKVMEKDEILTAYLNNVYFGKDAYGISAAAKTYFGKSVDKLNLAESAMIVGITNNPGIYGRYSAAKGRQKVILSKMLELGYINDKQYREALITKVYFKSEIE